MPVAADGLLDSFSGGLGQRARIAQALLGDPTLVIVDEPTVGLDPEERVRFRNLLSSIATDRVVIRSIRCGAPASRRNRAEAATRRRSNHAGGAGTRRQVAASRRGAFRNHRARRRGRDARGRDAVDLADAAWIKWPWLLASVAAAIDPSSASVTVFLILSAPLVAETAAIEHLHGRL